MSLLGGVTCISLGIIAGLWLRLIQPRVAFGSLTAGIVAGAILLYKAGMLLWSSKVGKLRERERLLNTIPWRGDEMVLDVGCGRGLLLIGAAKRLKTGKAIGVDMWRSEDLSGNRPEATWANARAEGVADRIEVKDGDAQHLPFADHSFDIVVSRLVVHNIRNQAGRENAIREIARVLKPGGRVAILDIFHTDEYAWVLRESGITEVERSARPFSIFPPAYLVTGRKSAQG